MTARVEGNKPLEDRLSLVEVARHLNMSLTTVGRWASSGRIPAAVAAEGTWEFRLEDVDTVWVPGAESDDVTSGE